MREVVLPLLLYGGPVLPLSAALYLGRKSPERRRTSGRLLVILLCVQGAAFLPYLIAHILHTPHAFHALGFVPLVGTVTFLVGMVLLASDCAHNLSGRRGMQIGEPAPPPGNSGVTEGPPSVS